MQSTENESPIAILLENDYGRHLRFYLYGEGY